MVNKKKLFGMLAAALAFGLTLTSCSTVPGGKFVARDFTVDEVLGQVTGDFSSYASALEAAKKEYPKAQGVVYYTGKGGNKTIPWKVEIGYYAVTFKLADQSAKGGLF